MYINISINTNIDINNYRNEYEYIYIYISCQMHVENTFRVFSDIVSETFSRAEIDSVNASEVFQKSGISMNLDRSS